MSYLLENIAYYGIKLEGKIDSNELFLEEKLLTEFDTGKNRALYILYRNQDLRLIEKMVNGIGEKSLLIYFYKYEYELMRVFTYFTNEQLKNRVNFIKADMESSDMLHEIHSQVNALLYQYTQIIPVIPFREDLKFIQDAKILIQFIREKKENYSFLLGNDIDDTLYGMENRLINFKHHCNHPGIKDFVKASGGAYENKPAIIVSSGPSLDKNVHLLKEYQDKALILSCDGSYTTLLKHGIKPHIIGSVERAYRTYEVFYSHREFDKDLLLVAPAVVRSEIVNKFVGNTISLFKDKDSFGILMDQMSMNSKGTLWCGSSVAHLLFSFADYIGCNPIILIGQDLSFSFDGISHAGDSEVKEVKQVKEAKVWLRGNYSEIVPSTHIWEKFLITFKEMIAQSSKKVINATEGGAFIEGTELELLSDALSKYCKTKIISPKDIYYGIKDFVNYNDIESTFIKEYSEIFAKYYDLYKKVKKIHEENVKAIKRFNKGIKTQNQLDKVYDVIDKTENLVREIAVERMMMMLFQYPIHVAIHQINQLETKEYTLESLAVNLKSHYDMLSNILFNTKRLLKMFAKLSRENQFNIELANQIDWIDDNKYDFVRN